MVFGYLMDDIKSAAGGYLGVPEDLVFMDVSVGVEQEA
jgi:hypothetical protein